MALLTWPYDLLTPANPAFQVRPFSRGGGRSLGGIARTVRTDRGYWVASYESIWMRRARPQQKRTWNAIRVALMGTAGLVVVPICATNLLGTAGTRGSTGTVRVPHDDDAPFDDQSLYSQTEAAVVVAAAAAPIGTTAMSFSAVTTMPSLPGMRFSYGHALYEIGPILAQTSAGVVTCSIFPAVRQTIPAGAPLDFNRPDCLMHLATDSEMDVSYPPSGSWAFNINFVEAVDYWNDLAAGLEPSGDIPGTI